MIWKRSSAKQLREAYKTLFGVHSGPAGHTVFLDLFEHCGMAKTNFVPGDPYLSAFNDGCRSIFVYLLQMAYEPDQVVEKLKETASTEYVNE